MTDIVDVLDAARPVRAGEEIDAVKIGRWLSGVVPGIHGQPDVRQFPRGFSNLTYLLTVGEFELVLRRPPRGVGKGSAHDMGREYRILRALHERGGKVPRPIAFCDDESVLGAPFYVMERVRGLILRQTPPPGLDLGPATMRALSEAFVDALIEIHRVPIDAEGIAELGHPDGYVARQVSGWTKRYAAARTDDISDMESLAAWLVANQPVESGAALIHNDFKYDNLVLDPADLTRIVAVLDWEMATVGDPLMDLGTSLGYWVEPGDPAEIRSLGIGLTALPGNLTRSEVWARYGSRMGRDVGSPVFYYAFGLFKISVIAQQIYARFVKGLTTDERFGRLIHGVRAMARTAMRATDAGRIDHLGDA